MSRSLVIVDVQRDFLPGGALAVPDGDAVVGPIAELARAGRFDAVVTTQDWHPEDSKHFERWPVHCVAGSEGAQLADEIARLGLPPVLARRVFKGQESDGYSGFEAVTAGTGEGLVDMLPRGQVTVVGLALDHCVKATAMDAASLGWEVTVPLALTRPVEFASGVRAVLEMYEAGVGVDVD